MNLDDVKRRLAAATPGPWTMEEFGDGPGVAAGRLVVAPHPRHRPADLDLIAHAPADLAALIAEVERLRAPPAWPRFKLSEIGHARPFHAWSSLSWASCPCGAPGPYAPTRNEPEVPHNDDPVVCAECGRLGSAEARGAFQGGVRWDDDDLLRPSALAAFRRLRGLTPAWTVGVAP